MRIWKQVSVACIAVSIVAACSSPGENASSPDTEAWRAEIDQAKAEAEEQGNHLIQTVLSDNKVTEAELQSVEGHFVACLKEAGFEGGGFVARLDGGIFIEGQPEGISTDEQQALTQRCIDSSGVEIIEFAVKQRINPSNEDMVALSSRCMKARQLIDQEYTSKELEQFTAVVESLSEEDQRKAMECNFDPYKYLNPAPQ